MVSCCSDNHSIFRTSSSLGGSFSSGIQAPVPSSFLGRGDFSEFRGFTRASLPKAFPREIPRGTSKRSLLPLPLSNAKGLAPLIIAPSGE